MGPTHTQGEKITQGITPGSRDYGDTVEFYLPKCVTSFNSQIEKAHPIAIIRT